MKPSKCSFAPSNWKSPKLVAHPDGEGSEQYVLCRSTARPNKEAAMLELQRQAAGQVGGD